MMRSIRFPVMSFLLTCTFTMCKVYNQNSFFSFSSMFERVFQVFHNLDPPGKVESDFSALVFMRSDVS